MAQQKQLKQLILTDDKNIFTCCFQPIQRLQPNFKTEGTGNFMYTKHNRDNAKLRIFSFIPQRQPIQPNFMDRTAKCTYQTTKHTNTTRTTRTTTSTWVSPLTQNLCSYNWNNANPGVFIFKLCNKSTNFVHFIRHQFAQSIDPEKPVRDLMYNFVHFIHPNMNPLPSMNQDLGYVRCKVILFESQANNFFIS